MDGGRLVAALTIDALRAAGVDVTVLTPADSGAGTAARDGDPKPRGWLMAALASARQGLPATIARHAWRSQRHRVATHLRTMRVDVVHVEQVQALTAAAPALDTGLACVLRMHNVESDVWHALARRRRWAAPLLRWEATRLRTFEAAALSHVTTTVTLTDEDRTALTCLAPTASVTCIAPPAPRPETSTAPPLEGGPACVWLGTAGWAGNDDGLAWLRRQVWPAIVDAVPTALLHVFSGQPAPAGTGRVVEHGFRASSAEAFAPGSVLLLPLREAPGVRMRVLEAWARAVPVVATPAALRGLHVRDGVDVLIAEDAAAFARQVARLHASPALVERLQTGGRAAIDRRHAPSAVAAELVACYDDAIRRSRSR